MKWRLQEGRGEAIYEIGVADCGILKGLSETELEASLDTLTRMAHRLVLTEPGHSSYSFYVYVSFVPGWGLLLTLCGGDQPLAPLVIRSDLWPRFLSERCRTINRWVLTFTLKPGSQYVTGSSVASRASG